MVLLCLIMCSWFGVVVVRFCDELVVCGVLVCGFLCVVLVCMGGYFYVFVMVLLVGVGVFIFLN